MELRYYTCEHCGNTYRKGWTDEEADAEYQKNFGKLKLPSDEQATICDPCYQRLMVWLRSPEGQQVMREFEAQA